MNFVKKIAYATTLSVATLAPVVSSQVFAAPVAASTQQATNSLVQQLSGLQRFTADFEQSTKVAASNKAVQKKGLTAQHMNQTFKGSMNRQYVKVWMIKLPIPQRFYCQGIPNRLCNLIA